MRSLLLAATLALAAAPVGAAEFFLDGNHLYNFCQTDRRAAEMFAMSITDAFTHAGFDRGNGFCIPVGVKSPQVRDVICMRLEQIPANRHMSAAFLALGALSLSFPCPAD